MLARLVIDAWLLFVSVHKDSESIMPGVLIVSSVSQPSVALFLNTYDRFLTNHMPLSSLGIHYSHV